jgi:hypothetical protein
VSYRGLLLGAAASALGVGMFVLDRLAGPVDIDFIVDVSSDEGQYTMVALALIVIGATAAVASLIAGRDDPDRPAWVGAVSAVLVIVAVIAVALAVVAITFLVLFCRDGCN